MKNTVIITETAANDVVEQFDYICLIKQEPENAKRWLIGLYSAIDGLEEFAGFARAPESDFLEVELKQKIFKSHRIIYSFNESRHEVIVHYVRHGARRGVGEPTDDEGDD